MKKSDKKYMDKFKIYELDGNKIIEHLEYPAFKAKIAFNSALSDLEDIELLDNCTDPSILARVMREAADYLVKKATEK